MTKEEAIEILENGDFWDLCVVPYVDSNRPAMESLEALDMAIVALRAQPAKLGSRWEGCSWCTGFCPEVTGDPNWNYKFCPNCGRPLTEEAWAELERRMSGG